MAIKLKETGIGFYCNHPGLVRTNLAKNASWFMNLIFRLIGISPERGAKTLIYLTNENKAKLVSGENYYKKVKRKTSQQSTNLVVAQMLLSRLKMYLHNYIDEASLIFEKGKYVKIE